MFPPRSSLQNPRFSATPVRPARGGQRLPRFLLFCVAVLIALLCGHLVEKLKPGGASPTSPLAGSVAIRLPLPELLR